TSIANGNSDDAPDSGGDSLAARLAASLRLGVSDTPFRKPAGVPATSAASLALKQGRQRPFVDPDARGPRTPGLIIHLKGRSPPGPLTRQRRTFDPRPWIARPGPPTHVCATNHATAPAEA